MFSLLPFIPSYSTTGRFRFRNCEDHSLLSVMWGLIWQQNWTVQPHTRSSEKARKKLFYKDQIPVNFTPWADAWQEGVPAGLSDSGKKTKSFPVRCFAKAAHRQSLRLFSDGIPKKSLGSKPLHWCQTTDALFFSRGQIWKWATRKAGC